MHFDETRLCLFAENEELAYDLRLRTSPWLGTILRASTVVLAAAAIAAFATHAAAIWWIYGSFAVILAAAIVLDAKKRTREAGVVLSLGFWTAATAAVFTLGGVRSPGAFIYLPIVVTAGFFWSWRAAAVLAAASLGSVTLASWLDEIHRLPLPLQAPTAGRLLQIFAGSLTMTAILVGATQHTLRDAMRDVRRQALRTDELLLELEKRGRWSKRLELIGLRAGGVAHDFNNLLTVILSLGSVLEVQLPADSPARPLLADIKQAAVRAAELARELLSANPTEQREAVDIHRELAMLAPTLSLLAGSAINLSLQTRGRHDRVRIDRSSLERIAANLVTNARDAMPNGGDIVVEIASAPGGEENTGEPHMVELSVTDTGTGMDVATQQRVFEPFYTTKGVAGTGLGLPTVQGIAARLGGRVVLDSELGRGTKVRVLLPIAGCDQLSAETSRAFETRRA